MPRIRNAVNKTFEELIQEFKEYFAAKDNQNLQRSSVKITPEDIREDMKRENPHMFDKPGQRERMLPREYLAEFLDYMANRYGLGPEETWIKAAAEAARASNASQLAYNKVQTNNHVRTVGYFMTNLMNWLVYIKTHRICYVAGCLKEIGGLIVEQFKFARKCNIRFTFKELSSNSRQFSKALKNIKRTVGGMMYVEMRVMRNFFRADAARMVEVLPPTPHGCRMTAFLLVASIKYVPLSFWVSSKFAKVKKGTQSRTWTLPLLGPHQHQDGGISLVISEQEEKLAFDAFSAYVEMRTQHAGFGESIFGFSNVEQMRSNFRSAAEHAGYPPSYFSLRSLENGAIATGVAKGMLTGKSKSQSIQDLHLHLEKNKYEVDRILNRIPDDSRELLQKCDGNSTEALSKYNELTIYQLHGDLKPHLMGHRYRTRKLKFSSSLPGTIKALQSSIFGAEGNTNLFIKQIYAANSSLKAKVDSIFNGQGSRDNRILATLQGHVLKAMISDKKLDADNYAECTVPDRLSNWFRLPLKLECEPVACIRHTYEADDSWFPETLERLTRRREEIRRGDNGPLPRYHGKILGGTEHRPPKKQRRN
mmetsp:Transcript_475/g.744  ORF Transcript_475/g.744 Transcript_475/m.744 type:complete len:592 (-) Transcript_475:143-1918(-)